ncbi:MAG: hypothetical protein N2314_09015 [Brevinematales bacterium]|nr:hypothetical protein [Brevinematales bacterium]
MKIPWCDSARHHFLLSLREIPEILHSFYQEKRFFLISEILLQWIDDLSLVVTGHVPQQGVVHICHDLGIILTADEEKILREMEKASRKEEAYREFVEQYQENPLLLSLVDKLATFQKGLFPQ